MSEVQFQDFLNPTKKFETETKLLRESRKGLSNALRELESAVIPEDVPTIAELNDNFTDFAAKVSLIGQVKAGKTALANALLGVSELLPSDVNPWTSVVTSVHVNCIAPRGKKAVFKFFDTTDWDSLISNSGQIVKMAQKAKLDTRVEELTAQIDALRTRTEERLGENFKMLLGSQHAFSSFNHDLIKRYVCLGEDDANEEREGRFADLTKSADLYFDDENFSYPITIADTPGVNDPFMVREAATLENLRHSDIYVVVLSAHQALSTVDLGLLRLIKSLQANRLIVFINRIDELSDPQVQIEEIKGYVADTLRKQNIKDDISIIFGSAAWADAAIRGDFEHLPEDSLESLGSLIERRTEKGPNGGYDPENTSELVDVSGVSALRSAINEKAWAEVYNPEISRSASKARHVAERSSIYLSKLNEGPAYEVDAAGIQTAVDDLSKTKNDLAVTFEKFKKDAVETMRMDMAESYMSFSRTESRALSAVLKAKRGTGDWSPDTQALRNKLNAIYSSYVGDAQSLLGKVNAQVMATVSAAYEKSLGSSEGLRISQLQLPELPVPISLMRTMNIDLRASGSFDWLRRKLDTSVYLDQFEATIKADVSTVVPEACAEGVTGYFKAVQEEFDNLLNGHCETISAFAGKGEEHLQKKLMEIIDNDEEMSLRLMALNKVSDILYALENNASGQQGSSSGANSSLSGTA